MNVPIKSKGLSHFLKLDEQSLPDVEVWSAEHPNLYTLILELKDVTGKVTELTGCEVGFPLLEQLRTVIEILLFHQFDIFFISSLLTVRPNWECS